MLWNFSGGNTGHRRHDDPLFMPKEIWLPSLRSWQLFVVVSASLHACVCEAIPCAIPQTGTILIQWLDEDED